MISAVIIHWALHTHNTQTHPQTWLSTNVFFQGYREEKIIGKNETSFALVLYSIFHQSVIQTMWDVLYKQTVSAVPQTQTLLLLFYLGQSSVFSTQKCLLGLQDILIVEKGLYLLLVIYLISDSFLQLLVVLA